MAKIGCKHLIFKANESGATAIKIGALIGADLNINSADASLYGDDVRQEYVNEFISATLAINSTDVSPANEAEILGSSLDPSTNELVDNAGDNAPEGKLGYYRTLMVGGVKAYEGVYFDRAKASIPSESDATKGESVSFGTYDITFAISPDASTGNWRYRERFSTESACKTWLNTAIGYTE